MIVHCSNLSDLVNVADPEKLLGNLQGNMDYPDTLKQQLPPYVTVPMMTNIENDEWGLLRASQMPRGM